MMLILLVCVFGAAVAYPHSKENALLWDGKYGECPDVVVSSLMCSELDSCTSDLTCPGTKKCCAINCDKGNVCLNAVEPPGMEKPGQCPVPTEQPDDLCTTTTDTCLTDIECTSVQKCCETECGDKRCLIPTDVEEIIEQKWKSFIARKKEYYQQLQMFPPPPIFFQTLYNKTDAIKMCTSTSLEWKKCQRMANEFTYTLQPKREWGCALATSKEHCMFWLSQGYVDVMVTREEDVYTAKTKYNLKPVAYEVPYTSTDPTTTSSPILKGWQNVTLVIAPVGTNANTWSELADRTSCHAHANMTSAFKSPICSLIQKNIIPRKGDFVESAAEFFDEMCVPDILNKTYNKNETYPASLVGRCPETDKQRKYEGVEGSLKCIDDTKGQVTFVDHKVIQNMIMTETDLTSHGQIVPSGVPRPVDNYKLICQDRSYPLTDWQVKSCHVSMTAYPTMYMTPHKDDAWKTTFQQVLTEAVKSFTSKKNPEDFRVFESSTYTCPETGQSGRNVIFYDESRNFTMVTDEDTYVQDFLATFKSCNELQSKPRAKFCVTTATQYTQCMEMKKYFDLTDKVKDVSWGCVNASNDMECMKTVLNGTADLMTTDAMATFIAGHDFQLQPIISQYLRKESDEQTYDWKTYTYTVGVMKKSFVNNRYGGDAKYVNLTKLNTCHAGVYKVSSFHHPIGWLLANGTIPRIGSVFESVSRFFDNSCLPGVHPDVFRWDRDLVLGHEVNWGIPGLYFFNFTEPEWFIWNSPHTWSYFNWNGKTPRFFRYFFKGEDYKGKTESSPITSEINAETLSVILDQLPSAPDTKDYLKNAWSKWKTGDTTQDGVTLTDRIKDIIEDRDSVDPTISKMWSQLLKMRFDAIDQVDEALAYFHDIPTMTNTQNEDYSWLNHPAIKSFLQVYTPQLLDYFSDMFDNNELRERDFSRYSNPLWLSPTFDDFLEVTKTHQTKLCQRCIGYDTAKCTIEDEPYSGFRGSLNCLKDNSGDIVFVESHQLDKLVEDITDAELDFHDMLLVCPTGEVVDYVKGDVDLVKRCNFGRVPQPAIVTAYNRSGSYRWNVTKALLYAQEVFTHYHQNSYNFKMFGVNSVFHPEAIRLYPINLVNQTYEPWLGPMFLRSMEALTKPSSFDWWKETSKSCWGETYTNVLTQRNDTCNAKVKDVTCVGNPPKKAVYMGRTGYKEKKMVQMCSRPTKFTRKMAQFSCNNGETYFKTVMVPTTCECVPCEEMAVSMDWNRDYFWTQDDRKYTPVTPDAELESLLWGNEDYWSDNTLNPNFQLKEEFKTTTTTPGSNTTPKETPSCEAPWTGATWHSEWYPQNRTTMCRVPGLTKQEMIQKMIDRWN
ncbi:major yolk protein-like [Amphiura filiformis]|uniref:major yolk protein-like n=1 Tax=Amphiura filiformis TaxID=82378 RepID=UPI003B223C9A